MINWFLGWYISGAQLSGAQFATFSGRTVGPRTTGPRGPTVRGPVVWGPTVRGPIVRGPICLEPTIVTQNCYYIISCNSFFFLLCFLCYSNGAEVEFLISVRAWPHNAFSPLFFFFFAQPSLISNPRHGFVCRIRFNLIYIFQIYFTFQMSTFSNF